MIDPDADLGEHQVFDGPEADVAIVRLALEHEGIPTIVRTTHNRGRLHGGVYVIDKELIERAREIVARHVKGGVPSDTALAMPWLCPNCGEVIEGQFQACWKCGTEKR